MSYVKPLPEITEPHRPFWEGLHRQEFSVPKCLDCGNVSWPPYPACRRCQSERFEWVPGGSTATIYSFTVVHRGPGAFDDDVPYVIALAELDEHRGSLVLGNVVDCDPETLAIGRELEIRFEDIPGEDVTLWRFAPRMVEEVAG
jgi:uncharacterized OB-fold protein